MAASSDKRTKRTFPFTERQHADMRTSRNERTTPTPIGLDPLKTLAFRAFRPRCANLTPAAPKRLKGKKYLTFPNIHAKNLPKVALAPYDEP